MVLPTTSFSPLNYKLGGHVWGVAKQIKQADFCFTSETIVSFCGRSKVFTCTRNKGAPDDRIQTSTVPMTEKCWRTSGKVKKEGKAFILIPPGFT